MTDTELARFRANMPFPLDDFQVRGCEALESGRDVLVCAPTGAGKTVVGEFAVHLALAQRGKCFYTTPIKALSNQKYHDLCAEHGEDAVGLLTGDLSLNGNAPIVVMTTEVLRNMIYAGSPTLRGLRHVVMDEVHYLADRFRGPVWEEVILNLDQEVRLTSLSATVSNAEQFGDWLGTVRGDTSVVVSEIRPVPLDQHMLVGHRLFDMFADEENRGFRSRSADAVAGRGVLVNPDLVEYARMREQREGANYADQSRPPGGGGRGGRRDDTRRTGFRPVARPEVIAKLDEEGLLPAITFIFSRLGCDAAVSQCLRSRLSLTTKDEAREIREILFRHTSDIPRDDLDVCGFDQFRRALERGFAAHHAGMLPAFRHAVEEVFVRGLVRAVFATETLALGINMPARSVVLERLVKYDGEAHVELTPGEYTQLTGRAGRRGIDTIGHAVVLWQPGMDVEHVAGLASTRTYPLRSAFSPGYNMSVNLLRRLGLIEGRELLERSFAQFQTDSSVVGLARSVEKNERESATLEERLREAHVEGGDFLGYMRLRESISARERELEDELRRRRRDETSAALLRLRRGDVIALHSGRRSGWAVVVDSASESRNPRVQVCTDSGWAGRVGVDDFRAAPERAARLRVPRHIDVRRRHGREELASSLHRLGLRTPKRPQKARSRVGRDEKLIALRKELTGHPCHLIPDLDRWSRLGERLLRLERDTVRLRARISAATDTLGREYERVLGLLAELGYVDGLGPDTGVLTEDGERLARLYSESDLLLAQCLRRGIFDDLDPAELAAALSCLVYESRREARATGEAVTEPLGRSLAGVRRLWNELRSDERRHRLPETREPDEGFATAIHQWTCGAPLAGALLSAAESGQELSAGDFVRWARQVVDLLEQARECSPDAAVAESAAAARNAIRRGVVAVGSI